MWRRTLLTAAVLVCAPLARAQDPLHPRPGGGTGTTFPSRPMTFGPTGNAPAAPLAGTPTIPGQPAAPPGGAPMMPNLPSAPSPGPVGGAPLTPEAAAPLETTIAFDPEQT